MAVFDVLGAKKEGYSDEEIASYLAGQSNFDIEGARKEGYSYKDIIQHLNKTGATPWETFLESAKQEVGSEVKGAYQLAGGELDTAEESLRRQMESENPLSGVAGTVLGGLVNPTTLIPGTLWAKGMRGVALAGAVAGGTSGLLQPVFDEDSRLLNTAVGTTGGLAIAGVIGLLAGKFGRKAATEIVNDVVAKGANTAEDIIAKVKETTGVDVSTPKGTTKVEEAPNVAAAETVDSVSSFKPIFDSIDSTAPEQRKPLEDALLKGSESGDYTEAIKTIKDYTTEFEFGKSPLWKMKDILSEDNPFYAKNLEALRELGFEQRANSFKVLQSKVSDIQAMRQPDPAAAPNISEALQLWSNRNIGEIFDVRMQQEVVPWLERQLENFSNLDVFYRDLIQAGVPEREALTLVRDSVEQFTNITSQVLGNRSQAARVLGDKSTVKLFGSLRGMMKMLDDGTAKSLDTDTVSTLVDSISKLRMDSANGTIDFAKATAKLANKLQEYKPTTGQKFSELITNIYTSGLQTAAVNAWSPPIKMLLNGIENTILTLTPGSSRFLDFKRSAASFSALLDSFKEAAFFAKAGFLEGKSVSQPGSLEDIAGSIGKHTIGGENVSPKWEQALGKGVRFVGSNPSVGIDEFFKTYFRKMSLYDSYHQIAYSGRFKGREAEVYNELKKIDTSGRNWTEKLSSVDIKGVKKSELKAIAEKAIDYAKLNTFQADLGKFGNDLLRIKSNNPAAALVIPFVKTPINILKEGLSYTPLGLIPGMTPTKIVRKNGRIVRDEAGKPVVEAYLSDEQKRARTAMGVGAATLIAMHVGNNEITGAYPRDPGKRAAMQAAGIPEYSIKIGDKWIPYGRIEPLATSLGMVVDSITNYREMKETNPKDVKDGEYAKRVVGVLSNSFVNKTFLQGLSGALQAINDPERYGDSYIKGFASLAVPGVVAQFAKAADPNARVTTNFAEAVQNRLPGMRQELPVQYNLLGAPVENPAAGVAAFTGMPIRSTAQTPVQAKIAELKIDYAPVDKTFKGVKLSGAELSRLQQLSGEYIERRLTPIIEGGAFDNLSPARQKYLLEKKMQEARALAVKRFQGEMMRDPIFREELIRQKLKKKGVEIE